MFKSLYKTCCILCCIIFFNQTGFAQKNDSLVFHKVLLLPYDPKYYLSDADADISKQTKQNPEVFRSMFRTESDRTIYRAMVQKTKCVSVMQDSSDALTEDVIKLLSTTGFEYDTPTIKDKKSLKEKLHINTEDKTVNDSRVASQYINTDENHKYMKAIVTKPDQLETLYKNYGFDLFVFITQMEIKTNYASCMDIANKIYKREIILNFTVYNKNGTLLVGNFSKSFFPSDNNNAYTIAGTCFPQLAQGIIDSLQ